MSKENDENIVSAFIYATRGEDGKLRSLLEKGLDPDLSENELGRVFKMELTDRDKLCLLLINRPVSSRFIANFENKTLLMYSVEKRCVETARLLLDYGASIHKIDSNGRTALFYAVTSSRECVELLVENGAEINITGTNRSFPLLLATEAGDCSIIKYLIDNGADIEAQNAFGISAMIAAAAKGYEECVEILALRGADVNKIDNRNRSALLYACQCGHLSCIEKLLEFESNINMSDSFGHTCLIHAVRSGNSECVQTLVDKGANLNSVDTYMKSALLYAVINQDVKCIKILLDAKATIDITDFAGRTPIMHCAEIGAFDCLKLLIEYGANVDIPDFSKKTAIMYAVLNNNLNCLKLLLETSIISIDAEDESGKTALMFAAGHSLESFKFLVWFGADICKKNNKGMTVLMASVKLDDLKCFEYLLELIQMRNVVIQRFLEERDNEGITCLMYAAMYDSYRCMSKLIQIGARVDVRSYEGNSPVMYAAMYGSSKCLGLLLTNSTIDINQVNSTNGRSPLMLAAFNGQLKCVEVLVENGASLTQRDHEGRNSLMLTSMARQNCIKYLLEAGSNVNDVDKSGYSALMLLLDRDFTSHERRYKTFTEVSFYKDNLRFFLNKAVDVNLKSFNNSATNQTECALSLAVKLLPNDTSLAEILITESKIPVDVSVLQGSIFNKLVAKGMKILILLLVHYGISPVEAELFKEPNSTEEIPEITGKGMSPLGVALMSEHLDLAYYFVANCFLVEYDFRDLFHDARVRKGLKTFLENKPIKEVIAKFLEDFHSNVFPLVKLAQVKVSWLIGASSDRKDRIKKSGLAKPVQRLLRFQGLMSKTCRMLWVDLKPEFDSHRYNQLPSPFPLVYYWPVGKYIARCDHVDCYNHLETEMTNENQETEERISGILMKHQPEERQTTATVYDPTDHDLNVPETAMNRLPEQSQKVEQVEEKTVEVEELEQDVGSERFKNLLNTDNYPFE